MNREQSLKLADDLQRLCCAETEGKFFDLVTDSIDVILAALRAPSPSAHGAEVVAWQEIDSKTPRDRFIIFWCREDDSYWWAKWQGGMWHGVDEQGLTRDSDNFTPDYWREIPSFGGQLATPSQPGIELREALQGVVDIFYPDYSDESLRLRSIKGDGEAEVILQARAALTKATEGAVTLPAADRGTP